MKLISSFNYVTKFNLDFDAIIATGSNNSARYGIAILVLIKSVEKKQKWYCYIRWK